MRSLPTIADMTGAKTPAGVKLDGVSFAPQLRGEKGTPREWIYCYYCPRPERTQPVRFVRNQRWKLYGDGRFFDVETDPMEKHPLENVGAGSAAATARRKLSAALDSMPAEGRMLLKVSVE